MQLRQIALALLSAATLAAPLSGVEPKHFDPTIRMQDDLFGAVNGGWDKTAEIPADRSSWGITGELRALSESRVRELIEQAAKSAGGQADTLRIANFYQSFMDEAAVERLGLAPVKPILDRIAAIDGTAALTREFGRLQKLGVDQPFALGRDVDARDSRNYLLQIYQGGLGLPDRDYYLQRDKRMTASRAAYQQYLATLFALNGAPAKEAGRRARAVLALETRLARIQWSQEDMRDPIKTYHKLSPAQLADATPGFDWALLMQQAEAPAVAAVNLNQPSYAAAAAKLIAKEPIAVWRDYLTVRVLDHFSAVLPRAHVEAAFRFHGQALSGAQEMRPRWKRAVALIEQDLGEAVGKLYVERYFPPETKAKIDALVRNLLEAYRISIDQLSWMSPATKVKAQEKLAKYAVKIGYPDKWRDFGGLEIKADDLVGNVIRAAEFNHRYELAHLGQPVDRSEWGMTPQTVNAYYNPSMNEIVFPAAYLQPPYFDPAIDDAANYGNIGATIGHEISHGFDDSGAQFDGDGNLNEWWTPADKKAFEALSAKLVAEFNGKEALPGRFVNGKLTLGENIADLSGLQVAYKAYRLSLGGKEAPVIDGYSGDQRFFIGYASSWREKVRGEMQLQYLIGDPHAPDRFRANAPASNTDAFHAAFGTKAGDKMYKPAGDRIRIW
ncbi:M13 family metallopeptidase [Chitinimonas koreensis]|uniref:M13 family metallopeptidase n=1 Tax=Chitinimonas koreensis TaxID=356302 RepID=UPI000402F9BC|nr:M13 family metallopeptidase [Chitinimonas koreensis]